jgi:hypothetical protein
MSSRVALLLITLIFSDTLIATTQDGAVAGVGTPERIDFVNQFAGEPEQHVPFIQYQNFEPVSERSLILYETMNRAYLVDIEESCWNLPYARGIFVNHGGNTLSIAFDSIVIGDRSCRITGIRPLDIKAMKAAEKAMKSG